MEDGGHLGPEGRWSNDRLRGILPPGAERQRFLRILLLEYPFQRDAGIDYDRHAARLRLTPVVADPGAVYLEDASVALLADDVDAVAAQAPALCNTHAHGVHASR